jgi:cob(I)alamin adenosyltransferase
MTGRLDEVMKYIELNKTSTNNDDIDEILIKKIEQLLEEIEQPTIHGPSKESITKYREKMIKNIEEGIFTCSG